MRFGKLFAAFAAASLFVGSAARADEVYQVRLFPGARLVGTRAPVAAGGHALATLAGSRLRITGDFRDLAYPAIGAALHMGVAAGVRGPVIATLTASPATKGTLQGDLALSGDQVAALHLGHLYIEIDSAAAQDGEVWGWLERGK
jgi:hypothetical protein